MKNCYNPVDIAEFLHSPRDIQIFVKQEDIMEESEKAKFSKLEKEMMLVMFLCPQNPVSSTQM